jgi:RNA 2',3'-cyclic 3'-phosphodiesterase
MARLRTFIAVGLDQAIRDRTVALQETLSATGADVKWVEPENLHLTLLFLGDVNDRDVLDVCRAVTDTCKTLPAFPMSVETTGCFPNPRRPRTLWVGVGEGTQEVCAVHDALEKALLKLGCYRREERRYTPHVTLGRVKSEEADDKLIAALAKNAGWKGGHETVREVLVMSSELGPKGPTYSVLSRAKLGTPAE